MTCKRLALLSYLPTCIVRQRLLDSEPLSQPKHNHFLLSAALSVKVQPAITSSHSGTGSDEDGDLWRRLRRVRAPTKERTCFCRR
jgi:hypothetical protein